MLDFIAGFFLVGWTPQLKGEIELIEYFKRLDSYMTRVCNPKRFPLRAIGWMDEAEYSDRPYLIGYAQRYYFLDFADVAIRKSWWVRVSDNDRLYLLTHELGHAQFDLPHEETGVMSYGWTPGEEIWQVSAFVARECRKQDKVINYEALLEGP